MYNIISITVILIGFITSYYNRLILNKWDNSHFFKNAAHNLIYPNNSQLLVSIHAITMLFTFVMITIQIFIKITSNRHMVLGYLIIIFFPISIFTAIILIFRNPLNFPWFGLLLAFSDAFMMIFCFVKALLNIYLSNFNKHKKYMKKMYIWMGAPGYLRILYKIYPNFFSNNDDLYVCRATNRGFMFGAFWCILLIYNFKIYKIKWYFFFLLLYIIFEEKLLWGCKPF